MQSKPDQSPKGLDIIMVWSVCNLGTRPLNTANKYIAFFIIVTSVILSSPIVRIHMPRDHDGLMGANQVQTQCIFWVDY